LKGPGNAYAVVPLHKGETLGSGLLQKIIASAGLTLEEFKKHL
jgi:predicted RNA binding protein YcfA (HicA-like mRNA interferase family)